MAKKGSSTTIYAHGDGTYHTTSGDEYPPEREEHESLGAALMHIAKLHGENDHMHIEGHENGFTTHHVMDGGQVQGPDDHANMRDLKRHVQDCMEED